MKEICLNSTKRLTTKKLIIWRVICSYQDYRLIVSRKNDRDDLHLKIESDLYDSLEKINLENKIVEEMKNIFNLRGTTELVEPKSLPNDGKIIDDIRDFGEKQ